MKSALRQITAALLVVVMVFTMIPESLFPVIAQGSDGEGGGNSSTGSALDGDYAYIKSLTIDFIEDGIGNFDTEDNIAQVLDSSGNLQTVESPGNDVCSSNGIVRTYDSIIYHLNYETDVHEAGASVVSGTAFFRFILPLSSEEAVWDLDDMNWMQNAQVTETESNGITYQVLTGSRLLTPGENATNVFPGWGSWRATVKVLAMHNGDQVMPTFQVWLENNCTEGICPEHHIEEVQTVTTEDCPITVTCAPKYNIQLKTSSTPKSRGYYDFSQGNEYAFDKDAGTVYGRPQAFGITIQLYNDRADKGLMGLELPTGPISFDLELSSTYTPYNSSAVYDVTDTFTPLVWAWGPQTKNATSDNGGRDPGANGNGSYAADAAPFNEGGTEVGVDGSEYCMSGGIWTATKDGNTVHFTVSGYAIDIKCFPNTDGASGATTRTYYNPRVSGYKAVENIGCFSAGNIYVLVPFYDEEGRSVNEYYPSDGEGTFYVHLEDKNLKAEDTCENEGVLNQVNQTDDTVTDSLYVGTLPGSFSQYVLWSTRERIASYDVFNGSDYRTNGLDWQLEGGQIAITWGGTNNENAEQENRVIAEKALMKFDPAGVTIVGEVDYSSKPNTQTRTALYAAKKDGTTWVNDTEMVNAAMEDFVYYSTLAELEAAGKICVGILVEVDPARAAEKVEKVSTTLASVPVTVKEGAARLETYMCTEEIRVWTLSQYQEWGVSENLTSSALAVPSMLCNNPDNPITLPSATYEIHPIYNKTVYSENGGYESGHNGLHRYGDSLLVLETKAVIRNEVAQHSENAEGVEEQKVKFDLDYYERTVDYALYPRLTNLVDSNGLETLSSSASYVKVTVQDILPAGVHYISDSAYYGGTYVQNAQSGTQGSVSDGTPMEPTVTTDPATGVQTLTWVIDNVLVAGDMDPIYFSATIGTPSFESTDVKDGDRLMNTATIRATGDYRNLTVVNGNVSEKEITVNKLTAGSLSKVADEEHVEGQKNGTIGFTLIQSNLASSKMESVILDTLPYNGDSNGSAFVGNYTVDEYKLNTETDDITGWLVYYTTDLTARGTVANQYTKEDIISGSSALADGSTVTWIAAAVAPDGSVPDLQGKTPTAIVNLCSISGNKRYEAHLTLKKNLYNNEIFVNTLSCGNAVTMAKVDVYGGIETVDVSVTKVWDDADNQDGKRPASVTVRLYADGAETSSAILNSANSWTYSFAGLDKYKAGTQGQIVTYDIREDTVTGYTTQITSSANGNIFTYTVKNSCTTEKVSVNVQKVWNDSNNQDGKRTASVTVRLYADGAAVSSAILNSANSWTYSFAGLDKYKAGAQGKPVVYDIREDTVAGYSVQITSSASGNTFTYTVKNSHVTEKVQVNVQKVWNDSNNQDGKRAASVTVRLYADGTETSSAILNSANGWAYSFAGLDKYNAGAQGQIVTYDIREDAVIGYTTQITSSANGNTFSYTVTNSCTTEKVSVNVQKVWKDADNQDGKRAASVTVRLYADGAETSSAILNSANSWTYSFAGLDKYKAGAQGQIVTYDIREDTVTGYTTQITSSANGNIFTYTVKNSCTTEKVSVNVQKVWNDSDNQDGKQPASITVRLFADGTETSSAILNAANCWTCTFAGLNKYKVGSEGILVIYDIREDTVEGYTVSVTSSGYVFTVENTHITEKTRVPVEKQWNDEDDTDGIRPASITVFLLADGAETGEFVILSSGNAWAGAFEDLPVNKNGTKIVYTVREVAVEAYSSAIAGNAAEGFTVTNTHTVKKYGNLVITKVIDAEDKDVNRDFGFRVIFTAGGEYEYRGVLGGTSVSGTIRSGDTVRLKHGDRLEIIGLPEGTEYTVTEIDYDGYTVQAEGATGIILPRTEVYAAFTNTPIDNPDSGDRTVIWSILGVIMVLGGAAIVYKKKKKEA